MKFENTNVLCVGQRRFCIHLELFPRYIGLPTFRKAKGFWILDLGILNINYTNYDTVWGCALETPIECVVTTTHHEESLVADISKEGIKPPE